MDAGTATIIASLGIGSALIAAVKAIIDRRKTSADVTQILNRAAVELVEPLATALARERVAHEEAIVQERTSVRHLRDELHEAHVEVQAARQEIHELRNELAAARQETREAHAEVDRWRARVQELEHPTTG